MYLPCIANHLWYKTLWFRVFVVNVSDFIALGQRFAEQLSQEAQKFSKAITWHVMVIVQTCNNNTLYTHTILYIRKFLYGM